jgi:hypothetical protein
VRRIGGGEIAKPAVSSWRNSRVEKFRESREIVRGKRGSGNAARPIL